MDPDLRKAIVLIETADAIGTGFLVGPDLVLTAYHVVADDADAVQVKFLGTDAVDAALEDFDETGDWALLSCKQPGDVRPIPLAPLRRSHVAWHTAGFSSHAPGVQTDDDLDFDLKTSGIVQSHSYDFQGVGLMQLHSLEGAGGVAPDGWSGSPILVEDSAVGIMRMALTEAEDGSSIGGVLWATSVAELPKDALPEFAELRSDKEARISLDLTPEVDRIIDEHRLFAGRESELEALDEFVRTTDKGYCFVTGPSGTGKTAFMSNWIRALQKRDIPVCYHLIAQKLDTSEVFALRSLCRQLGHHHGVEEALPSVLAELRSRYRQLLTRFATARLVVVIDGLDEAGWTEHFRYFPEELAVGTLVVFSARSDREWLDRLEVKNASTVELKNLTESQVESVLRSAGGRAAAAADQPGFVKKLWTASNGDPFYVNFLVEDIGSGETDLVPAAVDVYLGNWWNQIAESYENTKLLDSFLGYLACAEGRVGEEDLGALTGDHTGVTKLRGRLRRWLTSGNVFQFDHARLRDYTKERLKSELPGSRARLLEYCLDWKDNGSHYALCHLPQHLEDLDDLCALARDTTFADAQARVFPGSPGLQLRTARSALRKASSAENAARHVELAFLLDRREQSLFAASPLEAAREKKFNRAWGLAELHPAKDAIIWKLLIAWEDADKAKQVLERLADRPLLRLRTYTRRWYDDDREQEETFRERYAAFILAHLAGIDDDAWQRVLQAVLDPGTCVSVVKNLAKLGKDAAAQACMQFVPDRYRDGALRAMASEQAQRGEFAAAMATASALEAEHMVDMALSTIVRHLARAGRAQEARETALGMSDNTWKTEARAAAAQELLKRGNRADAEGMLEEALKEEDPNSVLAGLTGDNVAPVLVRFGRTKDAMERLERVVGPGRAHVLQTIAEAQAETDIDAALRTTAKLPVRERLRAEGLIAGIIAKNRSLDEANAFAQKLPDRRWAAYSIARFHAQAGRPEDAANTLREHGIADHMRDLVWDVAQTGDIPSALELSRSMPHGRTDAREDLYLEMAGVQAARGDAAGARSTLAEGMPGCEQRLTVSREDVTARVAWHRSRRGEVDGALAAIAHLSHRLGRFRVLRMLAADAMSRDPEAARRFMAAAEHPHGLDTETRIEFAALLTEVGDIDRAVRYAKGVRGNAGVLPRARIEAVAPGSVELVEFLVSLEAPQAEMVKAIREQLDLDNLDGARRLAECYYHEMIELSSRAAFARYFARSGRADEARAVLTELREGLEPIMLSLQDPGDKPTFRKELFKWRGRWGLPGVSDWQEAADGVLRDVAETHALLGDLAEAERIGRLTQVRLAETLADLGVHRLRAGDNEAARALFTDAVAACAVRNEYHAPQLGRVALTMVKAGESERGLNAIGLLSDNRAVSLLCRIAGAQADREAARETLARARSLIENLDAADRHDEAVQTLAAHLAGFGLGRQALEIVELIQTDHGQRLPQVAMTLAEAGDTKHLKELLLHAADLPRTVGSLAPAVVDAYPDQLDALEEFAASPDPEESEDPPASP